MERNANVFQFQGSKMIVSAKGPNINKNFTMNTSFRSNLLSSTMNMPRNFEKQSSAASVASQRSIYGRDTSPTASLCSDLQPRNFHQPFYQRGFSQRSVYHREGSPMSMRSIDSTVSRADIVIDAIQSCSEDEWKKIWHAVNRKHEIRKKKDEKKRRKMKMFLKNIRHRSEDEGEQGSRSSISNDDCASTRTGYSRRHNPYYKENIPRSLNNFDCRSMDTCRSSNRDAYPGYARSDTHNPYQTGMNAHDPVNILPYQKQPQFAHTNYAQRNGYSHNESTMHPQNNTVCGPRNTFSFQRHMNGHYGQENMTSIQRSNLNGSICSNKGMQNMTIMSQRDRFRGGFQFPSQKFNRSTVYEAQEQVRSVQGTNKESVILGDNIEELSEENDDIFLAKPKSGAKKTTKRKAENLDDIPNPAKKKPKMTSSNNKLKQATPNENKKGNNQFEFVKPKFPVRKSAPVKPKEKLISKSSEAPDLIGNTQDKENREPQPVAGASPKPDGETDQSQNTENTQLTTSDMSMRPSFMKRKLFTQTLDVTEKKNNSFNSGTDSPQSNNYSALTREKHKTRKLVTSQSLLSRDINQDDDNLLDLIHKIIPPKQVNSTINGNITKPSSRVSGNKTGEDKWDITSIISTCNNDSVSETYTDDEIFRNGIDNKKSKAQEKPVVKKNTTNENNKKADVLNDYIKENDKPNKLNGKCKLNEKPDKPYEKCNKPNVKSNKPSTKPNKLKVQPNKLNNQTNKLNNQPNKLNNQPNKLNDKPSKHGEKSNNPNEKPNKSSERANPELKKNENNNTHPKNNKTGRDVVQITALPAAPKSETPMKICPAKRAVLSRSRIDAFWDTDESDHEGAGACRAHQPAHLHDHTRNFINSPKEDESETPASSVKSMNINKTQVSNPIVVLHNIEKDKHPSKKIENKPKKEPKTSKKSSNDNSKADKLPKTKKDTTTITPRTRRQLNLSATVNSHLSEKEIPVNGTAPTKTIKRKQNNEKLVTQEKNKTNATSSDNGKSTKKDNHSHRQMKVSKKEEKTPKNQRTVINDLKPTKILSPARHLKIDMCKVLRSRNIDLSSSFNSDKFELTMSRTRKSRTPSKRISFNKSKNILVNNKKVRNRATKT